MDESQHDEINLIRLVRRLEKSVANTEDWKRDSGKPDTWLKAQSGLQKVKFARKLVRNVELDDVDQSPKRIKQVNDTKIKLDKIESFFKDMEKHSKPNPTRPKPILPTLSIPKPRSESSPPPYTDGFELHEPRPQSHSPHHNLGTGGPSSPGVSTTGLFISPPDPSEISPTLITSAIPSLLPANPTYASATTAFTRANATPRKAGAGATSTALQEELSSQLEIMAAQLKRNAIHFSNSLAKDQAVVEDAQQKLERNHDVLLKERVRLRDRHAESRGTTCWVFGIVVMVLLLFMLMASVIRFSRL
ncbi:hypothetical protein B0H34DRAFT_185880 [Crassisporium funariophilum]|nr:hypothetical protein B0H34DRAFT_185880 [Crassisporium funariophilum]